MCGDNSTVSGREEGGSEEEEAGGSERRVLLSGSGVSGGADGVPVPSGADNLILKRRDRRDQSVIDLQRHSQYGSDY